MQLIKSATGTEKDTVYLMADRKHDVDVFFNIGVVIWTDRLNAEVHNSLHYN